MSALALPDGSLAEFTQDPSGNERIVIKPSHIGYLLEPPAPCKVSRPPGAAQWYIPYTSIHPDTVRAAPKDAIWVYVGQHPRAYLAALLSWWGRGQSFAINEHDVLNRPDVVEQLDECPEPWCAFGYDDICCQDPADWRPDVVPPDPCPAGWSPCMDAWSNVLGCTRYRKEIIEAVPDAIAGIAQFQPAQNGNPGTVDCWDWHNVCDGVANALRTAGFTHHWHWPPVGHHHERVQGEQRGHAAL